ncbi:MAG TPA: Gfo/Idh/MocA family oxidoreductase [Cyclobacteriaceae bacterium]|nr:Gfo/Idh/MocA family oxidoreductase [Cyclobacteriaceae bacterium]
MQTRRKFLHQSVSVAAASFLSPLIVPRLRAGVSQNDKITIALIGCNGMGWFNLTDHLKFPEVECGALCDVDENVLNKRSAELEKLTGKKPKLYRDYRQVLDDKSIDAVIVATPDHWHCLMAVNACEAGKDVYVEKPLANSIAECEAMLKAARKFKRVMQVGQQQRSGQHWQDIVGIVKSGKLGTIRKVKTWGYFPYGSASPKVPDSPTPAGVDYDMWLGPAPSHPFNKARFHGSWRFFWEQGGGLLTDWGVHLLDIPLLAMGVSAPKSISSSGGIYAYPNNAIETADTQTVVYDFGNFLLEWDHVGGVSRGQYGRNYGVAFIGNNGTLVVNREGWEIIAEMDGDKPRMETTSLQPADNKDHEKHVRNFLDCLKSRQLPICDVEFGRNAAVLAHMGNISYRTGNKLWWDDTAKKFKGDEKANGLITPVYRAPWKMPA